MKRFFILATLVVTTLSFVAVLTMPAQAVDSQPITEEHVERIRTNCVDAQSTLYQLHATDAGLRVNRGQLYESMATKVMAPLNSRIVLNRLDSVTLVSIADEYNKQLQQFRARYQEYERAMSTTLDIKCMNEPVTFYDSVTDARKKRALTHDSAMTLHQTIKKYGEAFEVFAKDFQADKS